MAAREDALRAADPFAAFDDEPATFLKPRPGGSSAASGGTGRPPFGRGALHDEPPPEPAFEPDAGGSLNPLVALANPLLLAVPTLRNAPEAADLGALRESLARELRRFASRAASAGLAQEQVMAARYVLCTALDEAAADTPWGGSGAWAQHSLLALFHNEVSGGEKVFRLMARLAERPAEHRDLLELIYAALALGFEGRFRVAANGHAQLEAVRDRLAQVLRQQRGAPPRALADHWRGTPVAPRRAFGWLPLATAAALAALGLAGAYAALALSLGGLSDPVYAAIQGLKLPPPMPVVVQPAPRPRLAQYLQADIKAGLVSVRDEVDRSVVTVQGDGLFAPASAALLPAREALIARVGDALAQVPGRVLVTGHTDASPIGSARFPSNWHLSQARAETVRDLLVQRQVAADRIGADGRADSQGVAPNDTAAHRARNRRVEITLVAGRSADTGLPPPANTASNAAPNAAPPEPAPAAVRVAPATPATTGGAAR